jgi:hypothetical protein
MTRVGAPGGKPLTGGLGAADAAAAGAPAGDGSAVTGAGPGAAGAGCGNAAARGVCGAACAGCGAGCGAAWTDCGGGIGAAAVGTAGLAAGTGGAATGAGAAAGVDPNTPPGRTPPGTTPPVAVGAGAGSAVGPEEPSAGLAPITAVAGAALVAGCADGSPSTCATPCAAKNVAPSQAAICDRRCCAESRDAMTNVWVLTAPKSHHGTPRSAELGRGLRRLDSLSYSVKIACRTPPSTFMQ